jgi:hypothetical protein
MIAQKEAMGKLKEFFGVGGVVHVDDDIKSFAG